MSIIRRRKAAAVRLGLELEKRYEALAFAKGEDEIAVAAVHLGELFNDNIEFIIWGLKKAGGLNPPNPEPVTKPVALPKLPESMTGVS